MPDPNKRYGGSFTNKELKYDYGAGPGSQVNRDVMRDINQLQRNKDLNKKYKASGKPSGTKKQITKSQLRQQDQGGGGSLEGPSGGGGTDPTLQALTNMLAGFNVKAPSESQLASQARSGVNAEYNPRIAALQREMEAAKARGKEAKAGVGGVYNSLVKYYTGNVAPTKARNKEAKAQAAARTASLKSEITADYTNRLKEQVEMYKQLGIESAAGTTLPDQQQQEAEALTQAGLSGETEQQALTQEGLGDIRYLTEAGGAAKQEGAEAVSSIESQLQDYLNKQGGQIAGLKGEREAMYAQGLAKLKAESAASTRSAQEEMWKKMMQISQLKNEMQNQQFNQQLAGSKFQLDLQKLRDSEARQSAGGGGSEPKLAKRGLEGVLGLDPTLVSKGYFMDLLQRSNQWAQTPDALRTFGGKSPVGNPESMAQIAKWNAQNRGWTPEMQARAYAAMLRYYGR